MPDKTIDIVMFNMSAYTDWQQGIANRNMHVLHTLLGDERVRKVVAVDYLPFTLKRAVRQWFQNILGGPTGQVLARGFSYKLTAVKNFEIERTGYGFEGAVPEEVQHKLFVFSSVQSLWREGALCRQLAKEIKRLNLKNVVLWTYLPTFVGCFGALGEKVAVFDAVDNWLEHSAYTRVRDRLKVNYQTIKAKADIIFTTSEDLAKLFDLPQNCYFVPNGVDFERINQAPKLTGRDIAGLARPIIGYIGTIQEDRVEVELIRYLAQANPQKSFVLIGGVWPGVRKAVNERLRSLPNVHLLGRKSFRDTPQYLREFDVAIIPHKQNEFNRHTNPMKLYEYLAAGKPVVATPGAGLEQFKDLVYLAGKPEEFNQAVIRALKENSTEAAEKRQMVAAHESWRVRVNLMLEQVFAKLDKEGEGVGSSK